MREYFSVDEKEEILKTKNEFENYLKDFIFTHCKNIRISNFIGSRVKNENSIINKMKLKNIFNDFESRPLEKQSEFIFENINDLIGFRIECWFFKDEEEIYKLFAEKFKDYLLSVKKVSNIDISFNENELKQKNGKNIFKFKCRFGNCGIEVQIKSSMHTVWGEIEHKKIYKNYEYSKMRETNEFNMSELHNILCSSNSQLKKIWDTKDDEENLIKSLFYIYSNELLEDVIEKGYFYEKFFKSINSESSIMSKIKEFVSKKILNEDFEKENYDLKYEIVNDEKYNDLKEKIENKFSSIIENCEKIYMILFNSKGFIDILLHNLIKEFKYENNNKNNEYIDSFDTDENDNENIIFEYVENKIEEIWKDIRYEN